MAHKAIRIKQSNYLTTYVEFGPHNMTSNSLPSPFVASASSEFTGTQAFHAFDGGVAASQYWLTNGTSSGWLKIDLGSGNDKSLSRYAIRVNTIPEPNRAPKNWTFEGSNDNSTWDVLDTQTNQTGWSSGETRTFTLSIPTKAYRYFRLNVSANNGDAYLQCGELYLYQLQ